jgi:hypothetical protein
MVRAKVLAALGALALSAMLFAPASATPLPIASQDEMESMTRAVAYRQCVFADGHRLCRTYYEGEDGDQASASPDYGYYGAPGIYLGYSGGGYPPNPGMFDDEGR